MSTSNDGSESVDQFLARIASLKEGIEIKPASRGVDEEFLKNRQERQARRLERARSLSPSKTGPARPTSQTTSILGPAAIEPPVDFSPRTRPLSRANAVSGRISPAKEFDSPPSRPVSSQPNSSDVASPPSGLGRSGTLSWQQRPQSKDGARQRPVSGFATVRSISREPADEDKTSEPTRTEIAASLASKDPAWFRQTQDRAINSAAFRKNQVEDIAKPMSTRSMQLPGMSRSREPSKSPAPEAQKDVFTSAETARVQRGTTPDIVTMRESMSNKPPSLRPYSQEAFPLRPSSVDAPLHDVPTSNPTRPSSTLTQNRPASPTKGLGGFVESAMMKRSDSVNKRWSVKPNTGLKRGDSVAGSRPLSLHNRGMSRDIGAGRGESPSSPLASSRPGSSHDRSAVPTSPVAIKPMPVPADTVTPDPDSTKSNAKEVLNTDPSPQSPANDTLLARSPSKTMDPRRWSPTKSTWLESALQQSNEPPKLQPLIEEQPKWKLDLQRSKSRASRDVSTPKQPEQPPIRASVSPSRPAISPPIDSTPVTRQLPPKPSRETAVSPPGTDLSTAVLPASKKVQVPAPSTPSKTVEPDKKDDREQKVDEIKEASSKQRPVLKPKPETPPKTDFRATLRSRSAAPQGSTAGEPEFKSVFGKLKRATTQNYVAPDELKTNILTGKAALSTTGGPVKAKRVDEFKESILAKKVEMKAAVPTSSARGKSAEQEEQPIPEALARRKTLSKASAPDLASLRHKTDPPKPLIKPHLAPKPVADVSTESRGSSNDVPSLHKEKTSVLASKPSLPPTATLAKPEAVKSVIAEIVKPAPLTPKPKPLTVPSTKPTPAPSNLDKHMLQEPLQNGLSSPKLDHIPTSSKRPEAVPPAVKTALPLTGKLASRLNPNLVTILSRGPTAVTPTSTASESATSTPAQSFVATEPLKAVENASLTHMTKARAKGPKRRAPKVDAPANTASAQVVKAVPAAFEQPSVEPIERKVPPVKPTHISSPRTVITDGAVESESAASASVQQQKLPIKQDITPKSPAILNPNKKAVEAPPPTERAKPMIASKSPELRKVSSPPTMANKFVPEAKPVTPQKPTIHLPSPRPSPVVQPKEIFKSDQQGPKIIAKPVSHSPDKVITEVDLKPDPRKKLPTIVQGLGVRSTPSPQRQKLPLPSRELTPPPDEDLKSAHVPEIRDVIENYVGKLSKEHDRTDFDSQTFLTGLSSSDIKIKTIKHNIFEISGDGKKTVLPSHQQHILYEDAMYLVTHHHTVANGNNVTEVQLWCGDRVSDAAIDDAQIFCRRDAREQNTKLEVIKQGRETANFIEGMGGILIIRRSRNSALYMLCGRRHLGHIVFDEVDMASENLCPGFTYLLSAPYGKLFLWKGAGAGADEVGSARLIGNDLGLTGEIEEVDQGQEPPLFWDAVGQKKPSKYSSDWQKRSDSKGYPTVLYRIEHERPGMLTNLASWGLKRAASPAKQQVKATCQHIQAFTQGDLDHSSIHILDAYRTLYVILTRQSANKAAEFATSIQLAQDFTMLAPAIQDRPVLPTCYVVAGEMPADVKTCFRKWDNVEGNSLVGKGSICVRLEEVMETFDL